VDFGSGLKGFVWKKTDGEMRAYSQGGYLEGIWKISLFCLAKKQLKAYLICHKMLIDNILNTGFYPNKKPLAKVST
jgi:hypothetical protein